MAMLVYRREISSSWKLDPSSSAILPYPLQDTTSQWRRLWMEAVRWANKLDQRRSFDRIWYHLQKVAWYYLGIRLIINCMSIWGVRHTSSKCFFPSAQNERKMHLQKPHPVAVASGLDKNDSLANLWSAVIFFAYVGGFKKYKSMVIFRDFPYYHAFFWVGHIMTPCC